MLRVWLYTVYSIKKLSIDKDGVALETRIFLSLFLPQVGKTSTSFLLPFYLATSNKVFNYFMLIFGRKKTVVSHHGVTVQFGHCVQLQQYLYCKYMRCKDAHVFLLFC